MLVNLPLSVHTVGCTAVLCTQVEIGTVSCKNVKDGRTATDVCPARDQDGPLLLIQRNKCQWS